jgi:hypothetical protein
MRMKSRRTLDACRSALVAGLQKTAPQAVLDSKGYVSEASLNLIEGVHLGDFESDLRQGDGNEMEGKLRAAHSSSALAVNTFAPFKSRLSELSLPSGGEFADMQFERKCPHGLAGRRFPNLDVVAKGIGGVAAIESKCLEPLSRHLAKFAPAYDAQIIDGRRQSAWFAEMHQLIANPRTYQWLDAAQLVKHAFGLAYTFPNQRVTLLYLYWEPSNSDSHSIFAEHRAEIKRFATTISGGGPEFIAMSYPELWQRWEARSSSEWLQAHVARLRVRYGVAA